MAVIIFDAERMKYPNTGLFYFCLFLGKELAKGPCSGSIGYYLPESCYDLFPADVQKIKQRSLHKFLMPKMSDAQVWHTTYQLSDYVPDTDRMDVILTVHDLNFLKEGKSLEKERKYMKKLQQNIDSASRIIAISNYVKAEIEEYCDLKGKSVDVIYNGSNFNRSDQNLLAKVKPYIRPYLFTIGTIVGKKNFHVLPYMLVGNDLDLLIAGITQDESYKSKIITIAERCGVADRIKFLGAISEDEKKNYMAHCEIFVFPSIAEGFGLPVIEAMTLGKKTLLSNLTSLPEIGGQLSYYFDTFDEEYLRQFGSDRLISILNSETPSADIVAWSAQFSWEKSAQSYGTVYKSLIDGAK